MKMIVVIFGIMLAYTLLYMGMSHFWPDVFVGAD